MFKIINAGDGSVGKTTFLKRYTMGVFFPDAIMTIGTGFYSKTLFYNHSKDTIQLHIWDFSGQNRFQFFLREFILGANGALLFFDLTRRETFLNIGDWVELLRSKEKKTENLPIMLLGAKCDLIDEISVEKDEILQTVQKYDLVGYFQTSSKDNINVNEGVNALIDYIFKINPDFLTNEI